MNIQLSLVKNQDIYPIGRFYWSYLFTFSLFYFLYFIFFPNSFESFKFLETGIYSFYFLSSFTIYISLIYVFLTSQIRETPLSLSLNIFLIPQIPTHGVFSLKLSDHLALMLVIIT